MCKMQWGRLHETSEDIVTLTGKRDWTRDDADRAFSSAYARYHTPQAAQSPAGRARIEDDVSEFMETKQLPYYALSAAE